MKWHAQVRQSLRSFSSGSLRRTLGTILGIAGAIYALEFLTLQVGFFNDGQAVWWPTNGIALALLLRGKRRTWPTIMAGVLFGTFLGQLRSHNAAGYDLVNFTANSLGPLLAALTLPRWLKLSDWLQEPRIVYRFVRSAIFGAPLLSAAIYATYVYLAFQVDFATALERRGIADMIGYALFTPLALVLFSRDTYHRIPLRDLPRILLLLSLVVVVSVSVFAQTSYSLAFVLVSVTLLVVLNLGFNAAVVSVNLLAVICTHATMNDHGPLVLGAGQLMNVRIVLLQTFLTLSMIGVFSISVIKAQRESYEARLNLAYQKMELLAATDGLTGLRNRRAFTEALEREWARAYRTREPVAMLMIDCDHFKAYNDQFGHVAGDDCLRALATCLQQLARRSSDMLARYGGEEFILMLPTNTAEEAAILAEVIRASVESLADRRPGLLKRRITVSVGCAAITPTQTYEPRTLLEAADQALYRAKQRGRNCVEIAASSSSAKQPASS